jgi:hypothetical protein
MAEPLPHSAGSWGIASFREGSPHRYAYSKDGSLNISSGSERRKVLIASMKGSNPSPSISTHFLHNTPFGRCPPRPVSSSGITHPYSNFLFLDPWGPPSFPPVWHGESGRRFLSSRDKSRARAPRSVRQLCRSAQAFRREDPDELISA